MQTLTPLLLASDLGHVIFGPEFFQPLDVATSEGGNKSEMI